MIRSAPFSACSHIEKKFYDTVFQICLKAGHLFTCEHPLRLLGA
jgi:hypothetical protein